MQRDSPHAKEHFSACSLSVSHSKISGPDSGASLLSLRLQVPRELGKHIWMVVLKRLTHCIVPDGLARALASSRPHGLAGVESFLSVS